MEKKVPPLYMFLHELYLWYFQLLTGEETIQPFLITTFHK